MRIKRRPQLFSLLFLTIGIFSAYAKKEDFVVNGLLVANPEPVHISVDYEDRWFWESKTSEYNHNIARIAALLSEISYVPVEKNPESNELIQAYHKIGIPDKNIECNYILDYSAPIMGNNQAAYSFAYKDINTPHGLRKLVFIVLRGTPLSANEWFSNLNVSDSTRKDTQIHEGFYNTCTNIHKAMIYFMLKKKLSPDECYFLITGHSRGGALANLLSAILDKEGIITGEQLFTYTFASPNVTQEDLKETQRFNFIWNIVNAEDIVPSFPPNRNNWKWRKYGQTKVLPNYWNTNAKIYTEKYIPRMNKIYNMMLLRDYSPFKNGPFIQTQISNILTGFYKSVENYYDGFFPLHKLANKVFRNVFKKKNDESSEIEQNLKENPEIQIDPEKLPFLLRMIQRNVDANTTNGFEYAIKACLDMHACESYLSWMLALDENESFSTLGSIQLIMNGNYDCAVYDDEGNMLARILDGSIELYSLKTPVAGMPYLNKNVLGFPGNQSLNVVIHKASLIPTIVDYKIARFSASGEYLGESKMQNFYPQKNKVLKFQIGENTLTSDSLSVEKLSKQEGQKIAANYGLKQNKTFRIQPEISFSTEKVLQVGFRTGTQVIYGTFLGDFCMSGNYRSYGFSVGAGHQHSLYGSIMLDEEFYGRFVWINNEVEGAEFNFVPYGRLSLSYKPRHRVQLFAAFLTEARIKNFNDGAFDSHVKAKNLPSLSLGENLSLYPALQFGIRF